MSSIKMLEAVIFDWDGTLADTKDFLLKSFQITLMEIGCSVNDGFIERRFGIGAKGIFIAALKERNIEYNDKIIENLIARKIEIQMEIRDTVHLFDGVIELLDSLQDKVKMGLATMAPKKLISLQFKDMDIRKYFDVVITVDEVFHPKPDPEIFLKCAMNMNSKPERCVVIEDSIFGVEAAKEADMKCIAVTTGAYSAQELKEKNPDLIIDSIKMKDNIVDFILNN